MTRPVQADRDQARRDTPPSEAAVSIAAPAIDSFAPVPVPGLIGSVRRSTVVGDVLGGTEVPSSTLGVLSRLRGRGSPLPPPIASSMESGLGIPLDKVRVHTDPEAGDLAGQMQSTAFTLGSDIYFSPGSYAPSTNKGERLLAHELAHVSQQHAGTNVSGGALTIGHAADPAEAQADAIADVALRTVREKDDTRLRRSTIQRWRSSPDHHVANTSSADEQSSPPLTHQDPMLRQRQQMANNQRVIGLLRTSSAAITLRRTGAGTRERLAEYAAAVSNERWSDVATSLRQFTKQSKEQRIARLSRVQRVCLVRACLKGRPAWAPSITELVKAEDAEAERLGRLHTDWDEAVAASTWGPAAVALIGFGDVELGDKVAELSGPQLAGLVHGCLQGGAGGGARIITAVKAINPGVVLRANWDFAVSANSWGPAAVALNGFGDGELVTLVAALAIDRLRDLKQGALASLPGTAGRVVNAADQRISGAVIDAGAALVGDLKWRGGQGPDPSAGYQLSERTNWDKQDDFARWIRGTGPEPTPTSTMNCWEAVLFFGYKAGVIPKTFLDDMHQAATTAAVTTASPDPAKKAKAWYTTLQARMHTGALKTYTIAPSTGVGTPDIPAGNIVFIDGLNHVVLSRGSRDGSGRMRVLSLWIFPAHLPTSVPLNKATSYGVVQETSVEEVTHEPTTSVIEYGPPPW